MEDYGGLCARLGSRGTKEGTLASSERFLGSQGSFFSMMFSQKGRRAIKSTNPFIRQKARKIFNTFLLLFFSMHVFGERCCGSALTIVWKHGLEGHGYFFSLVKGVVAFLALLPFWLKIMLKKAFLWPMQPLINASVPSFVPLDPSLAHQPP